MAWMMVLIYFILVHTSTNKAQKSTFTLLPRAGMSMLSLGTSVSDVRLVVCASKCASDASCYNFIYHPETRLCSFGSWVFSNKSTVYSLSEKMYSAGKLCASSAGFEFHYVGGDIVCYSISTTSLNYTDARAACKVLGAHLYTVKTQEKLDFIITLGTNSWVGLDDMVREDTFVWEDGTVLDYTWRQHIFFKDEPNDYAGDEDCAAFDITRVPLNDFPCSYKYHYICEM